MLSYAMRMLIGSTFLNMLYLPFSFAQQEISLQLRWYHQFQFAGYYMALEKGFYQDAGIKVNILEGKAGSLNPVSKLLNEEVDFAVTNSGVAIHRMEGKPVLALAAIMQTSPLVWITLKDKNLTRPQDLIDKRVYVLPPPSSAELLTLFKREGLDTKSLIKKATSHKIEDLIEDKVDAFDGYISNEPFLLKELGYEYNLISPKDYGVNFYSDILVTTEKMAMQNPAVVKAFTQASLKGWEYALANIEESIEIIHHKYASNKSLPHLRYEAEKIYELVMPNIVQIGHMNPGRWRVIAQNYRELGMTDGQHDISGLFLNHSDENFRWLINIIFIALASILVLIIIAWRFAYLSSSLKREIHRRQYAENRLKKSIEDLKIKATHDPLTQIYNRRAFFEKGDELLELAYRKNFKSCIFMLDLDHFKLVNDNYGHSVGDQVLVHTTQLLNQNIVRKYDLLGRLGGEEFALLLIDCDLEMAVNIAKRILKSIETTPLTTKDKVNINITASIGVSEVNSSSIEQNLINADKALYIAKEEGRNRVNIYN